MEKITENKRLAFCEFEKCPLKSNCERLIEGSLRGLTLYLYLNMIVIKANSLWGRVSKCIRINQNVHLKRGFDIK